MWSGSGEIYTGNIYSRTNRRVSTGASHLHTFYLFRMFVKQLLKWVVWQCGIPLLSTEESTKDTYIHHTSVHRVDNGTPVGRVSGMDQKCQRWDQRCRVRRIQDVRGVTS